MLKLKVKRHRHKKGGGKTEFNHPPHCSDGCFLRGRRQGYFWYHGIQYVSVTSPNFFSCLLKQRNEVATTCQRLLTRIRLLNGCIYGLLDCSNLLFTSAHSNLNSHSNLHTLLCSTVCDPSTNVRFQGNQQKAPAGVPKFRNHVCKKHDQTWIQWTRRQLKWFTVNYNETDQFQRSSSVWVPI